MIMIKPWICDKQNQRQKNLSEIPRAPKNPTLRFVNAFNIETLFNGLQLHSMVDDSIQQWQTTPLNGQRNVSCIESKLQLQFDLPNYAYLCTFMYLSYCILPSREEKLVICICVFRIHAYFHNPMHIFHLCRLGRDPGLGFIISDRINPYISLLSCILTYVLWFWSLSKFSGNQDHAITNLLCPFC